MNWLNPRTIRETNGVNPQHREMNRLFDSFFAGAWPAAEPTEWLPPIDVEETADAFMVTAEIPGVDPKDVQVTAVGNEMTIRGEVSQKAEDGATTTHRRERRYGGFLRTLTLPSNVNAEKIGAAYRNGLLQLTLPKREESKPRTIEVATD